MPGAFDERGVARRHVLPPDAAGGGGAAWRMFYEGVSARNTHAVGLATSVDGLTWERANGGLPVFEPSADEGAWDARAVGSPHVVRDGVDADAPLLMFYAGNDAARARPAPSASPSATTRPARGGGSSTASDPARGHTAGGGGSG